MKKIKLIPLLSFCLFMLLACEKDFLELNSISEPSIVDFYKTQNDIENALMGCYDGLQSDNLYGRSLDRTVGVRGNDAQDDNASSSSRVSDIDKFQESAANTHIKSLWTGTFDVITRCNNLIHSSGDLNFNEQLKNQYISEALFIRALTYFNAINIWGDLPLIKEQTSVEEIRNLISEKKLIRNSISEIYLSIEEDLKNAVNNLPETNQSGRASKNAAIALLGKVYLYQKKWTEAKSTFSSIISKVSIEDDIEKVFTLKDSKEVLFSILYDKTIANEGHYPWYSDSNFQIVSPYIIGLYDAADKRARLVQTSNVGRFGLVPNKYFDVEELNQVGNNFLVLRGADVILMHSEASNELAYGSDDAFNYLNKVRNRAGLSSYTKTDLPDQESFREAIYLERKLEFALEQSNWPDLKRTGTAIAEMKKVGLTITADKLLFPIPQSEIEIINNPQGFPQNPDY